MNYVSLSVFPSEQASAAVTAGFPSLIGIPIIIEQVATPYNQGGAPVLSRIIMMARGLNSQDKVYGSAQTVAAIATALGTAGYTPPVSVYKTERSVSPVNVSFGNGIGFVIEPVTNLTLSGVPILSKVIISAIGARQQARVYFSGLNVAALITALG